jgi:hypothetical protein
VTAEFLVLRSDIRKRCLAKGRRIGIRSDPVAPSNFGDTCETGRSVFIHLLTTNRGSQCVSTQVSNSPDRIRHSELSRRGFGAMVPSDHLKDIRRSEPIYRSHGTAICVAVAHHRRNQLSWRSEDPWAIAETRKECERKIGSRPIASMGVQC